MKANGVLIGPGQPQPRKAPFYETLPADLGGGSIGEAPFNFHPEASDPPQGQAVFIDSVEAETEPVTVEHYGPVFRDEDETGAPLTIKKGICGMTLTDVTADFDFSLSDSSSTSQRTVTITPGTGEWETARNYVSPAGGESGLKCASVTNNPDAVYVWDDANCDDKDNVYHFKMNVSSQYDLNQSMSVNTADATLWTADPVDFNGDGTADAADLVELINHMD